MKGSPGTEGGVDVAEAVPSDGTEAGASWVVAAAGSAADSSFFAQLVTLNNASATAAATADRAIVPDRFISKLLEFVPRIPGSPRSPGGSDSEPPGD
jgi:hypothetical protein